MAAPRGERGRTGVALLGCTGSIGRQTVDVLTSGEAGAFEVVALAAGRDAGTISLQAQRLKPDVVSLADAAARAELRLPDTSTLLDAEDAMTRMATRDDVDLVIVATGGVVSPVSYTHLTLPTIYSV